MHHSKRKAERYIFTHPVSYSIPGAIHAGDNKGLILNIGSIGAAIITPYQLNEGDEILLESNLFALSLPAEVRWIQPVNQFFFRVGLEFRPEDQIKKKQIMNLIAVMKKFSALGSPESRQLQLEQVMSECIAKCVSDREMALCRNEDLLRNTLESTADGILVVNEKGEVTHSNKRFAELWHIPQNLMEETNDDALLSYVLGQLKDPEAFLAKVRELYQSKAEDMDILFFKDDRVFERFSAPLISEEKITGRVWSFRDITKRRQAEEALRQSEERQKSILESVQAGILLIDAETHVIADVNPAAAEIIGTPRENLIGSVCHKHICPEKAGHCPITDLNQSIDNADRLLITADGKLRSVLKTVVPVTIHGRKHLLESFIDITERKQSEKEHLLNETRMSSLLELSRMTDQADQALTDFTLEKAIELTGSTIGYLAFMNEDETVLTMYSWSRQAMKECLIETKPLVYPVETTGLWGEAVRQRKPIITNDYLTPDPVKKGYPEGHVHVQRHMNIPLFDGGRIVLVAGVGNKKEPYGEADIQHLTLLMDGMWKIIKQKRADEELRKSEKEIYESYSTQALLNILLSESMKNEPLDLILQKALNMMLSIPWFPSHMYGSIFLVEDQPDILFMKVRSDMTKPPCAQVPFGKCICGRAALSQEIITSRHTDELHDFCNEEPSSHDDYAVPIIYSGKTLGVIHVSIKEDYDKNERMVEFIHTIANTLAGIVERKNVEREKQRLHTQLLQAQKMEAIGTLAGGVAHDFNNLLMGILGYTSLMLMKTEKTHPFYDRLKIIEQQVVSGSELTKQLLGFARGGKYDAKPININDLIMKTSEIFGRTKKEIRIYRKLSDDLLAIEADNGQIEQVLLNLYVNAWQAMPAGGEIYLETHKVFLNTEESRSCGVTSGNYIKITVTDTGTGMDKDTQKRIFEPFFTTKELGRGTGLGLASAYGIIKNHNGMITVSSERGHGTTFTIYLPATHKDPLAHETSLEKILRGDETILFVDDEPTNIDAIKDLLETLGYTVYTAQSGHHALELYREKMAHIDLVILDMVMPGMNGKETLKKLLEIDGNVCVLLSSGYSIDGEANNILELGCKGFIQKPFRVEELSQKIRDVLYTTR